MLRLTVWLLCAINLVAFLAMGVDKWCAMRNWRRIPEKNLLLLAAVAGAPGIWLGARLFRHKTIKQPFRTRLVLASCANLLWLGLWWASGSI